MAFIRHGTLTASTVATVTIGNEALDGFKGAQNVEVVNRDGAAEIYFRTDGTDPVVGADDNWLLPAAVGALQVNVAVDGPVTVKLISAGTPKYSVTVA